MTRWLIVSSFWAVTAVHVRHAGLQDARMAQNKTAGDEERLHLGLLEKKAGPSRKKTNASKVKGPKSAAWYADVSDSESTYDVDMTTQYAKGPTPKKVVDYGKDPGGFPSRFTSLSDKPAAWYAETESAGPYDAWQTFYPSPKTSVDTSEQHESLWRDTPMGWVQDYTYKEPHLAIENNPSWFDSDVLQYDGYGRRADPMPDNPSRLLEADGWQVRCVNTTIACPDVGCAASASLNIFNPFFQEMQNAMMNFLVFPTDYEDASSMEVIEYTLVNGQNIGACDPASNGCNTSMTPALHPCFSNYDVTALVGDPGTITIDAKNSQYVDECPHEDNLLSGVVTVCAEVRAIPAKPPPPGQPLAVVPTEAPVTPPLDSNAVDAALANAMTLNATTALAGTDGAATGATDAAGNPVAGSALSAPNATAANPADPANPANNPLAGTPYANAPPQLANNPMFNGLAAMSANPLPGSRAETEAPLATTGNIDFQCDTPGCIAESSLGVNALMNSVVANGALCLMNLVIVQTDFDGDLDTGEMIEYVSVQGLNQKTDIKPGKNPCLSAYQGTPLTEVEKEYGILQDYDVTALVAKMSSIDVAGKLSQQVDECGYGCTGADCEGGYLLYGKVRIDCFPAS